MVCYHVEPRGRLVQRKARDVRGGVIWGVVSVAIASQQGTVAELHLVHARLVHVEHEQRVASARDRMGGRHRKRPHVPLVLRVHYHVASRHVASRKTDELELGGLGAADGEQAVWQHAEAGRPG